MSITLEQHARYAMGCDFGDFNPLEEAYKKEKPLDNKKEKFSYVPSSHKNVQSRVDVLGHVPTKSERETGFQKEWRESKEEGALAVTAFVLKYLGLGLIVLAFSPLIAIGVLIGKGVDKYNKYKEDQRKNLPHVLAPEVPYNPNPQFVRNKVPDYSKIDLWENNHG